MHSQPAHSLMHICNTIRCLAHTGTMCICTNTPHVQVSADTHTLHVPTCLFTWAVYAGIALQICLCTHTHTHTHHVKHTCTVYAYPHKGVTSHITYTCHAGKDKCTTCTYMSAHFYTADTHNHRHSHICTQGPVHLCTQCTLYTHK